MGSTDQQARDRKHGFALLRKANALASALRFGDASIIIDQAEAIFKTLPAPLRYEVLICLQRAQVLCGEQRWEEALRNYDQAFALREQHPSWPAIPVAAQGVRARLLDLLGRSDLARMAAQGVIDAVTSGGSDNEQELLAEMKALLGKLETAHGEHDLAASHFETALELLEDRAAKPDIAWRSLYGLGRARDGAGHVEAALDAYDEFVDRYRSSLDPEVQEAAKTARARSTFLRFGSADSPNRTSND